MPRAFQFFIYIFLLLFSIVESGCSFQSYKGTASKKRDDNGLKRRRVEEYFVSSGVQRYFLPEIPYWANFSEQARCRRKTSIKYFNMDSLRSSLHLDYEQSIQLQLMYNDEVQRIKTDKQIAHIPLENEEEIFYQVSDRIQAGIRVFRRPKFKRVNVVWVDPFVDNIKGLQVVMQRPDMYQGHPIFMSLCMTFREMSQWMVNHGFDQQNIRKMPYELLTPYSVSGELDTLYHLNFDELLKNKKVYIYVKKDWVTPTHLEGKFKIVKL